MPDTRSLREKLRAMADQTVSPHEAEVARGLLEKLQANRPNSKTPGLLTRDEILGAPDRQGAGKPHYIKVRYKGTIFTLEQDELDLLFGDGHGHYAPGLSIIG